MLTLCFCCTGEFALDTLEQQERSIVEATNIEYAQHLMGT